MAIVNQSLPVRPWQDRRLWRLPGMMPLPLPEWLLVDDAYAAQMAERARLLAACPDRVLHELRPHRAADELLETVRAALPALGFVEDGAGILRPDGGRITPDPQRPLWTLGHLLQADFCILERPPGAAEHVMTAAVLAFPASWTLAEKIGRPLSGIHAPVEVYDATLARRVQRLFDALRPEQPLMRFNAMRYVDPALFQPRTEADPRAHPEGAGRYLRAERQVLRRLPATGAVVFSINTWVVALAQLGPAELAGLDAPPLA